MAPRVTTVSKINVQEWNGLSRLNLRLSLPICCCFANKSLRVYACVCVILCLAICLCVLGGEEKKRREGSMIDTFVLSLYSI